MRQKGFFMYNGIRFTNSSDIEQILNTSLKVLAQVGVLVESAELECLLLQKGRGRLALKNGRIVIDPGFAEAVFLSGRGRVQAPGVSAFAEIYEGWYLDPHSGAYETWTESRLLSYIGLAQRLEHVGQASMLGCPLPGISLMEKPLYEKLWCFSYGLACGGSIWDTRLCEPIYEIWRAYARERQEDLGAIFSGTVYLLTPLRFGHVEAEQYLWFYNHGLQVGIGTLASIGLSVPVTPAGAIAEQLAEQLFAGCVQTLLFGTEGFALSSGLSVADPRTSAFQYGRPEQVLMNNAIADIAAHYSLACHLHCGLSDAKLPSYEAGVQKLGSALSAFIKGREGHIAAGLLSVDEVCSPVQMVLDNEAAGYLKRLQKGFGVDEEALAYQVIADGSAMPIELEHTVRNMRENIWNPRLFSSEMYSGWQQSGLSAEDKARDQALAIMEGGDPEIRISDRCRGEILKIIEKVR